MQTYVEDLNSDIGTVKFVACVKLTPFPQFSEVFLYKIMDSWTLLTWQKNSHNNIIRFPKR